MTFYDVDFLFGEKEVIAYDTLSRTFNFGGEVCDRFTMDWNHSGTWGEWEGTSWRNGLYVRGSLDNQTWFDIFAGQYPGVASDNMNYFRYVRVNALDVPIGTTIYIKGLFHTLDAEETGQWQ